MEPDERSGRVRTQLIPRTTTAIILIVCFTGSNMPTAVYSLLRADLNFNASWQTVLFAMYAFGMVPGLIISGPMIARFGRRSLLSIALLLSLVGAIAFLDAFSLWELIVARFLQGVSLGMAVVAGSSALYDAVPLWRRSNTALLITLTGAIGCTVGPIVAGFVADAAGRTSAPPFLFEAVAILLAALLLAVHGRSKPKGIRTRQEAGLTAEADVVGAAELEPCDVDAARRVWRGFPMIGLTAALSFTGLGVFQSIGPSLIGGALRVQSLGLLGAIVALVMGVAGASAVTLRSLTILTGRRAGVCMLLLGAVTFGITMVTGDVALALLSAVTTGIGQGLTYLSSTREIAAYVAAHEPKRADLTTGAYFAVTYGGLAVASTGVGMLSDVLGPQSASIIVMAAVAAASTAMLFSRSPLTYPRHVQGSAAINEKSASLASAQRETDVSIG